MVIPARCFWCGIKIGFLSVLRPGPPTLRECFRPVGGLSLGLGGPGLCRGGAQNPFCQGAAPACWRMVASETGAGVEPAYGPIAAMPEPGRSPGPVVEPRQVLVGLLIPLAGLAVPWPVRDLNPLATGRVNPVADLFRPWAG